jgi:hypothetical protein
MGDFSHIWQPDARGRIRGVDQAAATAGRNPVESPIQERSTALDYNVDLRDVQFQLFEWLPTEKLLEADRFAD